MREKLDSMVHSAYYQKFLQEPIVTQRGGRFVVPVKSEHRSEVPGLVHDSSGSGATVFIEPMAVVEANNEVRVLQNEERDEINRILQELSAECGSFASGIIRGWKLAVKLDLLFAKASLGYRMKATLPVLNADGRDRLKACAPSADRPKACRPRRTSGWARISTRSLITGPNTGGKTVALKNARPFDADDPRAGF